MPESNQISPKRMRFSSSSASEILTTSKSQYQRNRFGQIVPTVSHSGNRLNHSPSLTRKMSSKVIRTYPRVTIKDLRLRRVFTPSSISSDWEFKTKGADQTKEQDEEFPCGSLISKISKEGTKVDACGLGNAEAEEFLKTTPHDPKLLSNGPICEDINGPAVKKSDTNLCSKSVLHPCSRAKIFKNPGSFSYKRLLPYLMQAADDGTPSGRCSKPERSFGQNPPACNKGNGEVAEDPKEEVSELMTATKTVAQSVDRVSDKHSAGSLFGNTSPLTKVIASSPNKKSACSRRKLFKTPGSVNYRRMLPYLRDIQEDNPCVPDTVNHHPDHKKKTEENTQLSMLVSDNEGAQEMMTSNFARESDTCSDENKEPLPCEPGSVSPKRSPEKEQETQVKHVIPDTEKNLETPHSALGSEVQLSSPIVGSIRSSEVASSALNNIFVENLVGEETMYGSEKTGAKNSAEQLEANSSDLTAELLDPYVSLGTPTSISPSKGILKKSIRGCRGICSCLNCSSFRLNAERAFEFSRNQLQDTQVMVLDLVGEISHLREMLERYSADHNETDKSQAGEAAKRASEAAELAKSRLHQMNDDLQVHCRIPDEQRARVKFAHYVHEKTILKASQPNNLIPRSL